MKSFLVLSTVFLFIFSIDSTNADQCNSCKKIFNFISNVTHNGDANLKSSLTTLCGEYSHFSGQQTKLWCQKAVDSFFNTMNRRMNTTTICYDIQACKDATDDGIREIQVIDKPEDCDFCLFIANQVKDILTGRPTEVEIKTILEDGCHYFQSFQNECLNVVDDYSNDLFKFINESFQPKQLCKSLGVCAVQTGPLKFNYASIPSASQMVNILPANFPVVENLEQQKPVNDINCDICKKIVKIIQRQLKDNATDQQIIHVLTEVCELAPSRDRQNCQSVVTDYANKLIQILTQDIDSDMACTLVGLCLPNSFWKYLDGDFVKPTKAPLVNKTKPLCVECQLITHFIQNYLYDYNNEDQIEEFIKNHLCKKISLFVNESNCETFVKEYSPIILQTIAQEIFDPATFCYKEVPLCKKPTIPLDVYLNGKDQRCKLCQDIVRDLKNVEAEDLHLDQLTTKVCSGSSKPLSVECDLMMKAFASHFFEMLTHQQGEKDICKSIDICMVPGHVHLLGGHKCTYGPSYWCHTVSHADACNASSYCRSKVWKPIK